jgi:hypothetical protein
MGCFVSKPSLLFDGITYVYNAKTSELAACCSPSVLAALPRKVLCHRGVCSFVTSLCAPPRSSPETASTEILFVPSSVRTIGDSSFSHYDQLFAVAFEPGSEISVLGPKSFQDCSSLRSISLPSSMTIISKFCFALCHSLSTVFFEPGCHLSVFGELVFTCCESLQSICIPPVQTLSESSFAGCFRLEKVIISAGIENLGGFCFGGCKSLSTVIFECGSYLSVLGEGVFYGCASLRLIRLPPIKTLSGSSFACCVGLEEVFISAVTEVIGDFCFDGCKSLSTVIFECGSHLSVLGESVVVGCGLLRSIRLPPVQTLSKFAFAECAGLEEVRFGAGIEGVSDSCFWHCTSLCTIVFEADCEIWVLGRNGFGQCCSLHSICIPSSVRIVRDGCFEECVSLVEVIFECGIEEVGSKCFRWCNSLSIVEFKAGCTISVFGEEMFCGCRSLESIRIPSTVTTVSSRCFCGCSSLREVVIEDHGRPIGSAR